MKGSCSSSSFLFFFLLLSFICICAAARALVQEDDLKKTTITIEEEESFKIGSRPPSCIHKCYGCQPCEAIQVPSTTTTKSSSLGIQYANYEPEGWKCKCGPSFYTP